MNTIVYIALSILFFGCTFACGYCCAMTKVCKNMKEILESVNPKANDAFIKGVLFVSRGYDDRYGLLEEMADVYISLKLLESIFNVTPEEMQKAIDVKLARERSNQ